MVSTITSPSRRVRSPRRVTFSTRSAFVISSRPPLPAYPNSAELGEKVMPPQRFGLFPSVICRIFHPVIPNFNPLIPAPVYHVQSLRARLKHLHNTRPRGLPVTAYPKYSIVIPA